MIINFLDTETTGLKVEDGHRVIELAMVLLDLESKKIISKYEQRFNPQRSIDAKAQEVHGISIADVMSKPLFESEIGKINKLMAKSDLLVGHNLSFDVDFLANEYMLADDNLPDIAIYDTIDCTWATPMGKKPSLSELCFACDVEYDPEKAHSALYDVVVLAKAFLKAHKYGHIEISK